MLAQETQLIQAVKEGDESAFRELFDQYHDLLFNTVYYLTRDYGLAEDLVQDTFLKLWMKRQRLKPELALFPLLTKIAKNLIQDRYKYNKVREKHRDHVQRLTQKPAATPEETHRVNALEGQIEFTVRHHLGEKCRTVFLLSRVEGLSNGEIADIMKVSKKTVENQLYIALKVLRKKCRHFL